jgi:hypothetical protein
MLATLPMRRSNVVGTSSTPPASKPLVVDSAAEGLDQFADSIRERTVTDIFNDVEEVVRRRPAAVAAVTVAIGFLAARFIKSSAEDMRHGYGSEAGQVRAARQRSAQGQYPQASRGSPAGV